MQINIAPHLEQLLFEHGQVSLVGLGTFIAQAIPANVDYAGGTVSPPGKILTFNENMPGDDGLLSHAIAQAQGMDMREAETLVKQVVDGIKQQLDQREIVALPGIGRLYKNYVQKIQFLPDAVNFSRENYGLPQVQYSPIARSRETVDATASAKTINEAARTAVSSATSTVETPAVSSRQSSLVTAPPPTPPPAYSYETIPESSGLPWYSIAGILGVLLLSGGLGYYFWQMRQARASTTSATEQVTTDVPAELAPTPANTPESSTPNSSNTSTPAASIPEPPAPKQLEQPAPIGRARECILVVGVFKDENNIARLTQKIEANGLEVYAQETKSGAQVIGARFNYFNPTEIAEKKRLLTKISGEKNIAVKKQ
jgi:CCDC81-like prokaryotic HU domain 2/CCDC81-like prokaryotic HU domain 1